MPALNFQQRFAWDVEHGKKRQTIRAPRRDGRAHCKPGDAIRLYTGMRTKACRLLAEATVTRVTPVKIDDTEMFLDGRRLYAGDAPRDAFEDYDNDFAKKDGFNSFSDMADWFRTTHGLPFEGVVIEWSEPVG